LILLISSFSFAEDKIIIESTLFKGLKKEGTSGPEVIIASFSEPFFVLADPSNIEAESRSIYNMKNELNNIYQLNRVDHLTTGNMIWDGRKKKLNETISYKEFSYPINFSPRIISRKKISLRIEMSRFKGTGVSSNEVMRENLIDTEIILNFDEPVVLGFPSNGYTYFLSIFVTKKKTSAILKGIVSKSKTNINIAQTPRPVHKVTPLYPEKCKEDKIEGSVILELKADKKGNVANIRVIKPSHPDLDASAIEALKQWKYKPVIKKGKPEPVVFVVVVDFKLRKSAKNLKSKNNSKKQDDLEIILQKSADYCERLANSALHFICEETIKEEIQGSRGFIVRSPTVTLPGNIRMVTSRGGRNIERNAYVYDYQLIKKGEKIEETRTLIKENGKKKYEKNAPLKTKRFYSKRSVFGPVGFLGKKWQDKYNYKIIKEKTIKRRKTYVIEIKPKMEGEGKLNYGKVWIDKKDFSVLQIEIEQKSLAGFEILEQELKKKNITPFFTTTHYYFIEKNGIRFPSKTVFEEKYEYKGRWRRIRKAKASETIITYDKYRFFIVDVNIKY
jgi:TonB family protein